MLANRLAQVGQSVEQLCEILEELSEKGLILTVMDQGLSTSDGVGKPLLEALRAVRKFEEEAKGDKGRKPRPRGRKGGRPKALTPEALERAQALYDAGHMTVREIAGAAGVSEATLYRSLAIAGERRTTTQPT